MSMLLDPDPHSGSKINEDPDQQHCLQCLRIFFASLVPFKSEWKGTPGLDLLLNYCSLLKISVGGQVLAYSVSSLGEILAIRQLQGGGPI
jgi:hypothetical protein